MFAIATDYLMGWAMAAADGARKQRAEWPPHPDRLFMALAAAWFETGCDEREGAALRWLESLDAPMLHASPATLRSPVTHFVPVNDAGHGTTKSISALVNSPALDLAKAKDAGLAQLPQWRGRQPRAFPVAIPRETVVHFIWAEPLSDLHRAAIESLCRKLTSVGHSASLVHAWLDDAPPKANWVPGDGVGAIRLRVPGAGRLDHLDLRYGNAEMRAHAAMNAAIEQAKGKPRKALEAQLKERFPRPPAPQRPEPGRWQAYVRPDAAWALPDVPHSVFDSRLLVLSLSGQRVGLRSTLRLTAALRGMLLSRCAGPLPAWLTGHDDAGRPLRDPHLALLPLAFTSADHADGRLLGVALALPRSAPASEVARLLDPVLRDEYGLPLDLHLFDGTALDCHATLDQREAPPVALSAATWVRPSRRWASVTPIVLDRHCKGPDRWERAAAVVADACERIGLPRPSDVLLHSNSMHAGVPPAGAFAPLPRKTGGTLSHTHAVLSFDTEVAGPLLLGAGRFRGYGLCKPLREEARDD